MPNMENPMEKNMKNHVINLSKLLVSRNNRYSSTLYNPLYIPPRGV